MKWENTECSISRAQFRALLEFACQDGVRESINKICFDPSLARCSATDGHTLLVFEDMSPGDDRAHEAKPFCVNVEDAQRISKLASAKIDLHFGADDEHVLVVSAGIDLKLRAAESFFPDYEGVVPERINTAFYLQRVAMVAKALQEGRKAPTGLRMQPGPTPLDPIRFDFDARPNQDTRAVIVIMPRRLS